jgi:hypothetical protein
MHSLVRFFSRGSRKIAVRSAARPDRPSQEAHIFPERPLEAASGGLHCNQLTPSFFCSDEDEVVYWNSSFLPG